MTTLREGKLDFSFDEECEVGKYDDWSFYKQGHADAAGGWKAFQSAGGGSKAVDFVCVGGNATWLIEVKDYSEHERTKPSEIPVEIAAKVRDTLAGLAAAAAIAEAESEKALAWAALETRRWRVALHLEAPDSSSPLWKRTVPPHSVQKALQRHLGFIDPDAVVVDTCLRRSGLPWTSSVRPAAGASERA